MSVIIALFGIVPFIGYVHAGQLFCNAPCIVRHEGAIVLMFDRPTIQTIAPGDYTVEEARKWEM